MILQLQYTVDLHKTPTRLAQKLRHPIINIKPINMLTMT